MDWGLIGHQWAVDLLSEHVAKNKERHAYLITGPRGVGRRTLSLRFAQSLNCIEPMTPGQPCRKCSNCKRIETMQHPDLAIVSSGQEGEVLRIDQVRDLQHTIMLAPYEARYRVALMLRFEEAHPSAANALLKTLEEPPSQVIVMLTARSAESLLPTIVSRCEVIRLRPMSINETSVGLQAKRGFSKETAELLAHISGGRPGYAIQLYEQPTLLARRKSWLDELIRLLASSRCDRFIFAKLSAENNKEELMNGLQIWLTFWRDVLISTASLPDSLTNLDYTSQIKTMAEDTGLQKAQFYVSALESTMDRIDHNVNLRLALEVLLMDYPRINLVV